MSAEFRTTDLGVREQSIAPARRISAVQAALSACTAMLAAYASPALAVDLLTENFDQLALQNVVTFQSEVRGRNVWTPIVPAGPGVEGIWSVESNLPPEAESPLVGAAEFEGWTFVDRDWWVDTADDQGRAEFVSASGTIAVADPDEWDDYGSPTSGGTYDSTMRISNIPLQGAAPNSVKLFFHSSWRYEGIQKASLTVKYNDPANTTVPLDVWESDEGSPNFEPDGTNNSLTYDLLNPAGASTATLEFRLFDAGNNWWWAVDNLSMYTGAAPAQDGALRLVINRDTREMQIVNRTGGPVNLRGYSILSQVGALDTDAADFLSGTNANWRTLSNANTSDLSEGYVPDQYVMPTETANPNLGVISLGPAWLKYHEDINDVTFQYLVAGREEPLGGIVEFIGNGEESFLELDLNFDGAVNLSDYATFLTGYNTTLTGLSGVEKYNLGDLDRNGAHTINDFLEFKRQFDQIRGAGAFAAELAAASAVPEPTSAAILASLLIGACLRFRGRSAAKVAAALLISALVSVEHAGAAIPLLLENFDSLPLAASPDEQPSMTNVWTDVPPLTWSVDRSGVPGYATGDPQKDGVKDWAGWSFAKRTWWSTVAGGQDREKFTRGVGNVMVADPDEWDDKSHDPGLYNTFATTPVIAIPAGVPAGKIRLAFDSSWRPEGNDDDAALANNQTATVKVRYNGGAYQNVLTWTSIATDSTFHPDSPNEGVDLSLNYNGSATTLQLEFGLGLAENDWWWAVDNIRVFVPSDPAILEINTTTGAATLKGGDVIAESINGFDVSSVKGNLAPSGNLGLSFLNANPVDGPDADLIVGSNIGERWQLGSANANLFSEFFLDGSSTYTASRSDSLGRIFNPATPVADRDVKFTYTTNFGDVVTGVVQYVSTPGNADFNGDGSVDGADLLRWQRNLGSGTTLAQGNADGDGDVDGTDLAIWQGQFGVGGAAGALAAVPEPAAAALACFALLGAVLRRQRCCSRGMLIGALAAPLVASAQCASAQVIPSPSVDRDYRFGDGDPGAANGTTVTVTRDDAGATGMNQLIDLTAQTRAGGAPQYATITGRPDGGAGLGIRLNPNVSDRQYLRTGADEALNYPFRSPSSMSGTLPGGTIDYTYITDRGFQLWVQPLAATESFIVMDSNNHGALITAAGKFGMRYSNADYSGLTTVAPNTWYHLMVVRAFGDRGSGSVLYVNGVAEAAATGIYFGEDRPNDEMLPANQDNSPLVIGSSTSESPFGVGTQRYFRGIVDDLSMFVMGFNNTREFGEFEFGRDNDYAAAFGPSVAGDIRGIGSSLVPDGVITIDDVNAFAANWQFEKRLTWMQGGTERSLVVGDLSTRTKGDFNYDGRVDLADWGILNAANPAMGAAAFALINAVPEPASLAMAGITVLCAVAASRRRSTHVPASL